MLAIILTNYKYNYNLCLLKRVKINNINKGGQYMATLSALRQLGSDTKHLYDVNKNGQLYVDKHCQKNRWY